MVSTKKIKGTTKRNYIGTSRYIYISNILYIYRERVWYDIVYLYLKPYHCLWSLNPNPRHTFGIASAPRLMRSCPMLSGLVSCSCTTGKKAEAGNTSTKEGSSALLRFKPEMGCSERESKQNMQSALAQAQTANQYEQGALHSPANMRIAHSLARATDNGQRNLMC